MSDDETLALALALSVAESDLLGNQEQDTSRDEAFARKLQRDLELETSSAASPAHSRARKLPRPAISQQGKGPLSGKPPTLGWQSVLGGLKDNARKALNSLTPGNVDSCPANCTPGRGPIAQPANGRTTLAQVSDGCFGCGQRIKLWQDTITAVGRRYHDWCFVCAGCRKPLPRGAPFAVSEEGKLYHPSCHQEAFHPRCSCCGNFLPQGSDGIIRYRQQAFWRLKYCGHHDSDGTPRCHACRRLQPQRSEWVQLDDRHSCLECLTTMVRDTGEAQPLYDDVLRLYASFGMPLPTRPPLMLVESAALNEASSREGCPGYGRAPRDGGPQFHTRGLCLSEETRTVRMVVGQRQAGARWLQALPQLQQVQSSRWDVTAILVLCALPWLLTGSILAHEVMHAWLRLSSYPRLQPALEEGLAQLMALQWLERQNPPQGSFDERLQSYLGDQIRSDTSEVYGDGFRAALHAFQQLDGDLSRVLKHVKQTGQLPER